MIKRKRRLLLCWMVLLLTLPAGVWGAEDFKMGKHLSVTGGRTHGGSFLSLGGTIDIGGTLGGSLILFGGALQLDGHITEDVICVAADITLGEKARIDGDLYVLGGSLERGPGSVVRGEYLNFNPNLRKIETTLLPFLSDSHSVAFFKAIKIIVWLIIALIVLAVIPGKINRAREMFGAGPWKIGLIGLISLLIFIFLLIVSIFLCFVIVGIPLLFLLILGYFGVYILGKTVMFYYIGTRATSLLGLKRVPPVLYLVMGVAVYAILKFIPLLGPIVLITLNIFELGIGMAFLLRKKLKLEQPTPAPAPR